MRYAICVLALGILTGACERGGNGEGSGAPAAGEHGSDAAVPQTAPPSGTPSGPPTEPGHLPAGPSGAPTSQPTGSLPAEDGDESEEHDEMSNVLEPGEYNESDVVAQPGATMGQITQCPVSREVFVVQADSPHVDHEGHEVYFCCPHCIARFQRNPARYLL